MLVVSLSLVASCMQSASNKPVGATAQDPFWGRALTGMRGGTTASPSARPSPAKPGPSPAYVITAEEIHRMKFMTVVDALRLVPGVLVRQSEMKSIVTIRGTGDFPYTSRVLFLLDGIPINSPDTGTFPGFPMDHLIPMEEIDRIEVYKGPGSAMFGPGAFWGAINIVPKHGPIVHGRRGLATASAEHGNGSGGGTGKEGSDRFGMGMVHLMATPEGEPMASVTYGARDAGLSYSATVRGMNHKGKLEVQEEDFEHRIADLWLSAKQGPWSGIFTYMTTASTPFEFAGGANAADESAFHAAGGVDMMAHPPRSDFVYDTLGTREQLLNVFGKYDASLDNKTRVSAYASVQYRRGTTCASCHTGEGTADPFTLSRVPWAGDRRRIRGEMQDTYRTLVSCTITSKLESPFEHEVRVTVDGGLDVVNRDILVTLNGADEDQAYAGLAIEDRITLLEDRLWLTLVARADYLDYVDNELSWHAGLTSRPLGELSLGLSARSGFRPPTWDERNSAFVIMSEIPASVMGTRETGASIRSERIKSLDLNVAYQLRTDLELRFDGYYSRVSGFIDRTAPPASYRPVPPPMIFTWGNAGGDIDIRGFEIGLDYVPSHRYWFSAGWAFQRTDTPPAPKGFTVGEWPYRGPPYAPDNTVKLQVFTEPFEGLSSDLSVGWFDKRFVQFHMYPQQSIYHNWSDTERVAGKPLDSYFLTNLSISYRLPIAGAHMSLGLLVQDVFDTKPFEYKHHSQDPSRRTGREFTFMLMWMMAF